MEKLLSPLAISISRKIQLRKTAGLDVLKNQKIPAVLAGGKVSRKARTVNALIKTLFLVCTQQHLLTQYQFQKQFTTKSSTICTNWVAGRGEKTELQDRKVLPHH